MPTTPKPARASPRKSAKAMSSLQRQKLEHEVELLRTKVKALDEQAALATPEELHQRKVKILEKRLCQEFKKAVTALLPEIQGVFGPVADPAIYVTGSALIKRSNERQICIQSAYDPIFPPGWRF